MNDPTTKAEEREALIAESYMGTMEAYDRGSIKELEASLIYNIALADLPATPHGDGDPDVPAAQIADRAAFEKRVTEIVDEFIRWATKEADNSVAAGVITAAERDEELTELFTTMTEQGFADKVVACANQFIAELRSYTSQERRMAVLFGCHPEAIRRMGIPQFLGVVES
jgi:hypothetical protein